MSNPICFVDLDGVVNNHEWSYRGHRASIDPALMERLNRILVETDAKVVISSSWRHIIHKGEMTPAGFDFMLATHGMVGGRVIGCTPRAFGITDRGWEIESWLEDNGRPERYVVIDDMDLSHMHPAVVVDGTKGLTDEDVERAILILNR